MEPLALTKDAEGRTVRDNRDGRWYWLEVRHYPRRRWVRRAVDIPGSGDFLDTLTPEVMAEDWPHLNPLEL